MEAPSSTPRCRRARPTGRRPGRASWVALVGVLALPACSDPRPDAGPPPSPTPFTPSTEKSAPDSTARPPSGPWSGPASEGPADRSSERPGESSTGVPAGRTLRPSEGLTVTKDATVLEGLHIQGRVTIAADDVILRESLVQTDTSTYPIHVTDDATGVLIEDVEVDNLGGTGIGILISSGSTATIRRADIHSAEDGIRIQGDDVTIEDSYVHDLQRQSGGHHDTIQIRSGDNVTLEGNTLLPYDESTGDPMNAALQIGSLLGDDRISNLRVIDNYMNGGNYTINGGSEGIVDSAFYSGNRFGRDYRYGVVGNMDAASTWDDSNVFDDTGDPAR